MNGRAVLVGATVVIVTALLFIGLVGATVMLMLDGDHYLET